MFAKLLNYSIAFAVLAVVALVYQFTIVAWLTPPDISFAATVNVQQTHEPSQLEQMFPEGSWQRTARKRLSIKDQGVVLFSERKQITPSQWRVWPVTVIMQREGRPPIVLDAAEGADVTFAESLDVLGSQAPPIKSGQLVGKVVIRSLPAEPGGKIAPSDQLEIETRDVGIDNRRVWTNEAIRMRWGESRLEGRNLTIRLAGGGDIPTSGGQSPLSILDSMELIYLDRLQLPVPAQGRMQRNSNASLPPGIASIKCKGRVTFDFATDILKLRDSVRIEHKPHVGPSDRIECDVVTIEFNNPLSSELPRQTADDWLRRIEAEGQPVIVRLPTVGAEAVAETVLYDSEQGALHVQGSAGVRIAYQGVNFQATDFVYTFPVEDPLRVGTLDCKGSGFLDFQMDDELAIQTIRWTEGVRLKPLPEADLHELQVDGKVTATLSDGGKVLADALRFVFRQLPNQQPVQAAQRSRPANGVEDGPAGEKGLVAQFRPERASATGNVIFDTSLMYAETGLLQLFFDVQTPVTKAGAEAGVALTPASGATKRFWVRQPGEGEQTVTPVARPRPSLMAKTIHANLTLRGREIIGSDLTVDGDVRLRHQMTTPRATLPLAVSGDKMRLLSKDGHDTIQIQGNAQPARFDLGDGYFVGPLILISTSENYVWINQAGEFQMPTAVLPQGNATAAMRWAEPPRCAWSGTMGFDGQTVELSGGVRLSAEMLTGIEQTPWDVVATGDRMLVTLGTAIEIKDPAAMRSATIEDISLLGSDTQPVFLTADQADANHNLQARHVLSGPKLSLLPQAGQLKGPGPGWYRQWARTSPTGPFASFVPQGGLMGTHLVFNESMEGNLEKQELRFQRGVRIGVSPVASWEHGFDAIQMDALASGQATIDCQTLRLAQAPQAAQDRQPLARPLTGNAPAGAGPLQAGAWEVEALGGVVFRARNENGLFDVTGNRASYAAVKDLFIVEGDGRRPATLKQTQPNGLPGMNIALGYLKIRPQTMEIDSELQMASPGTLPANMRSRRN